VGTLQVIDYLQLLPADASGYVVPLNFMRDLFRHYTINSIFTQPAVNYIKHLLSTSAYQAVVPKLERDLLEWRQRAAQAGIEEAFSFLTELRLDLINTHQTMAETGGSVVHDVLRSEAHANQGQRSPAQNVQTTTEATMIGPEDAASTSFHATGLRKPKPADLSKLSETFTDLDARLRAIITALNDDIQIVIGSVQIQDAKAMKRQADLTMQLTETTIRQTEVSVRQTRWTVALAVLAALYLPMTLVTGIYGMNIREITGGEGPNWWWVVVTWAVTMGITVGSVGRYALVEWRWYRQGMQGPKVEGNQDSTEGIPGEQNHGTTKPAIGKADDIGSLSITRRKRLWRKISGNSQYNGTRSTV
jgi:Mg2+ and Co2+ transporter CorA